MSSYKIPEDIAALLESAAVVLFPLNEWILAKPAPAPDLPWRNGERLTLANLGVLVFLEHLIDESGPYEQLVEHLKHIEHDPIANSPVPEVANWRAERGLSPEVTFGIFESGNILEAGGRPLVRNKFYAACFQALATAFGAAKEQPDFTWAAFVEQLTKDESPFWPAEAPKSSSFIWQFVIDALHAMMGMQTFLPAPHRHALLIELSEQRRVGNGFTPADIKKAVANFEQKYNELSQAPDASQKSTYAAVHPPVGSPPVTATAV